MRSLAIGVVGPTLLLLPLLLLLALLAGAAGATTLDPVEIDFNELQNGEVVDEQYLDLGVLISAVNNVRDFDFAAIFDSTETGTEDPDLEFPASEGLLNILIVQEDATGCRQDGPDDPCDAPDDEGTRLSGGVPTGVVTFSFEQAILDFGFVLVDIEGDMEEPGRVIFRSGGVDEDEIHFADLPGFTFGDRSINRIAPIDLRGFRDDGTPIDEVAFELGGSGAIDDLVFTPVPEAGTGLLLALGLVLLGVRRRERG